MNIIWYILICIFIGAFIGLISKKGILAGIVFGLLGPITLLLFVVLILKQKEKKEKT